MKRQAKVAVVMGGSSAERDISRQTGAGVLRALGSLGYDATPIDYDERFIDAIRSLAPDVVFNALHGPGGEDGHVQALLDYLMRHAGQVVTRHQVSREKLAVIPRRIDGARFDPPSISPERAMVLRRGWKIACGWHFRRKRGIRSSVSAGCRWGRARIWLMR